MKLKNNSFLFTVIFLLGAGLCAIAGLTSCQNFLNGAENRKQLKESIAYANAQSCKLYLKADAATGSFLSGNEVNCKVGYTIDLQFTVNKADWYFVSLKAVAANDEDQSREEYVQFTLNENSSDIEKGIYVVTVKLLKPASDIMIKPKCIELPYVSNYTPSELKPQYANTPIVVYFNEPVETPDTSTEDSIFNYDNISLTYRNTSTYELYNMKEYFYPPKFNNKKTELKFCPNGAALKKFIENEQGLPYIDIEVSFSDKIVIEKEGLPFGLKNNSKSTFKVRYNSDVELEKPVFDDFFMTTKSFSLDSESSFPGEEEKLFETDRITDVETFFRNLVPSTFYIYI